MGCPQITTSVGGHAPRGIARVMAAVDRRSWSLLRGHFLRARAQNRNRPVEAAGAADAKNAPTAPWVGSRAGAVLRGARFQPPPRQTARADFPQAAFLCASRQGL